MYMKKSLFRYLELQNSVTAQCPSDISSILKKNNKFFSYIKGKADEIFTNKLKNKK